jgi:hypothetical protein
MKPSETRLPADKPEPVVTHFRVSRETMQVRVAQGVSLIVSESDGGLLDTSSALEMLRGYRAVGRRVVMCDTSQIPAGKQLGQAIVSEGCGTVLISCGTSGRDVAIGARDSGLDLANVVVCSDSRSACELLARRLLPGDIVLLLGAEQQTCDYLVAQLDQRAARNQPLAA